MHTKKDHRVCDGLPLVSSICLPFSLLLLQLPVFSVQIHRDADHDTQADDDENDGQNYFTHDVYSCSLYAGFVTMSRLPSILEPQLTISLLFFILELITAFRAVLEVFGGRVAAVVADLRPLALLLEEALLCAFC